MAVVTSEVEVPSSIPAPTLFKAFLDFSTLGPKAVSDVFKAIVNIKGDGGVGTIQETTFTDGSKMKLKIDAIDQNNFSNTITIFEGGSWMDNLETVTNHVKFEPSANGGSIYRVSTVFKCKDQREFTQEQAKLADEQTKKNFKAIEAYLIANPNGY